MTRIPTKNLGRLAPVVVGLAVLAFAGVALAAGDGPMDVGAELKKVGVHAVNFVLYVALLVFVLRRPLRDFLANRRAHITLELDEASRLREEAAALLSRSEALAEHGLSSVRDALIEKLASISFEIVPVPGEGPAESPKSPAVAAHQVSKH